MVSEWQLEAELIGSVRLELVMEGLPVRNCCLIYSRMACLWFIDLSYYNF